MTELIAGILENKTSKTNTVCNVSVYKLVETPDMLVIIHQYTT